MLGWFRAEAARASFSNRLRRSGSEDNAGRQDLDRDVALKPRVPGPVDLSHPAGAERAQQLVRAKPRTRGNGHKDPRRILSPGGGPEGVSVFDRRGSRLLRSGLARSRRPKSLHRAPEMRLRFADFVFDPDTREVFRDGRPVHVSPKAFVLLAALIERRPKAISKDDLHRLLWPETFVSDGNLPNLVGELRESLNDDAHEPRIIRTVPRFGYAFAAEAAGESTRRGDLTCRAHLGRPRDRRCDPGENVIGRDEAATLWIDDSLVSRRHARILVDPTEAMLEDLGSKNGTLLNGQRIHSPAKLADQDLITIGPASIV